MCFTNPRRFNEFRGNAISYETPTLYESSIMANKRSRSNLTEKEKPPKRRRVAVGHQDLAFTELGQESVPILQMLDDNGKIGAEMKRAATDFDSDFEEFLKRSKYPRATAKVFATRPGGGFKMTYGWPYHETYMSVQELSALFNETNNSYVLLDCLINPSGTTCTGGERERLGIKSPCYCDVCFIVNAEPVKKERLAEMASANDLPVALSNGEPANRIHFLIKNK